MKPVFVKSIVIIILAHMIAFSTMACHISEVLKNFSISGNKGTVTLDEVVFPDPNENQTQNSSETEKANTKGFPAEPVSYFGEIEGVKVEIIINFGTQVVTGTLSLNGDDYATAEIIGKIDPTTLVVTSTFSGIMGNKTHGKEYPFSGIINGYVSTDLAWFTGILSDADGESKDFSANR